MSLAANIGHAVEAGADWPRIGAFSYGFERDQLQPLITGFTRHGLSAVQLGSGLLDQALEDPAARAEIRALLEANGIQIAGLAGYRNLIAADPDTRRANLDHLKRCLEIAPELGTSTVATETGTRHATNDWLPVPENASEPAWSLFYAALDELLPVAERNGVSLSLEGYVNNVVRSFADVARVLERFPTPALQIVLDPYNYLARDLVPAAADHAADFLRRFDRHFTLAHLKDVGAEGAENDTPEFGLGVFPQEVFLAYLQTRRSDLPLIFEHLPFDHIPAAVERLRTLIMVKA
ncbi:MAG TPA: sugar phosphate isomerase/epimerase family protein [Chloroflexota bacterium]|nr:sugar phosphate isomerase/epimerase family protein [Chloroflexota bacterium]